MQAALAAVTAAQLKYDQDVSTPAYKALVDTTKANMASFVNMKSVVQGNLDAIEAVSAPLNKAYGDLVATIQQKRTTPLSLDSKPAEVDATLTRKVA
jgi:uncharacterized protein YecT (DUF1311 family)